MKKKALGIFLLAFVAVLFSVGQSQAQVVEKIKDAAEKTKDVTVDVSKKTAEVVTDGAKSGAEKTKDVTVDVSKKTASGAKTFGNKTVTVTENIAEATVREGKYYTAKTWDGTKWVSKQVWVNSKKAAEGTKDFVVGDDKPVNQ